MSAISNGLLSDPDIVLTDAEFEAVKKIQASDLADIVSLIRDCGYDPSTFFEYGRFRGMDFRGSDISGVSFYKAVLTGSKFRNDQYEIVLATQPSVIDGVIVFSGTDAEVIARGKRTDSISPLESFFIQLRRSRNQYSADRYVKWPPLTDALIRIESFEGRVEALMTVLDLLPVIVSPYFLGLVKVMVRPPRADAPFWLEEVIDSWLYAGRVFEADWFIRLVMAVRGPEECHLFLLAMVRYRVKLTVKFYKAFTAHSVLGLEDFASLRALMRKDGISPEPAFYSAIAKRSTKTVEEISLVREMMIEDGIPLDRQFYQGIVQRSSRTVEDIILIRDMMLEDGIRLDQQFYRTIAQRSGRTVEYISLIREVMLEDGIRFDRHFYPGFVKLFPKTVEDVSLIREMMIEEGIPPNREFYSGVRRHLVKSFDDLKRLRTMMGEDGIEPNPGFYSSSASKFVHTVGDVEKLRAIAKEFGDRLD